MDQLTHTVRRSNWINIIRQCQDRPAGTTAKQWLAENDISEKSYYYWLRKIRREVCEQEELQKVTNPSALSFVEIPVKTALDIAPVPTVPAPMTPVAVIRSGRLEYYGAAEPLVRCGESHLSGLTEPLRSLV